MQESLQGCTFQESNPRLPCLITHRMPAPLVYNLGEHTLIVTNDYGTSDAFELVAPVIDEATQEVASAPTAIFDQDETYRLYQCLHELFRSGSD